MRVQTQENLSTDTTTRQDALVEYYLNGGKYSPWSDPEIEAYAGYPDIQLDIAVEKARLEQNNSVITAEGTEVEVEKKTIYLANSEPLAIHWARMGQLDKSKEVIAEDPQLSLEKMMSYLYKIGAKELCGPDIASAYKYAADNVPTDLGEMLLDAYNSKTSESNRHQTRVA